MDGILTYKSIGVLPPEVILDDARRDGHIAEENFLVAGSRHSTADPNKQR